MIMNWRDKYVIYEVEIMDLKRYITSETEIEKIKNEYIDSNLSMKDMLNGVYNNLPLEDKVNLICWSADNERFKVLKNGEVVNKYTEKQLAKIVEDYAKEDGCIHYILEESDGVISQTCEEWIDCDIDSYAKENNMKILEVIYP